MRRFVVLALSLISAPAVAGTVTQPILGGTQATLGQFPTVVALELGGGGLCTGTLIEKEWVLTAAHCVQGIAASTIKVHFNTINLNQSLGKTVGAVMAIAKPEWQGALGKNDIGLIKLAMPVTDVMPLPVNLLPEKAPVGIMVTMVGFGATAAGGGGSVGVEYTVQQTSVTCPTGFGLDANLLCFNQSSGKGKCQGDSGGPSFAMIDGRLTQVGVTSFGDTNCTMYGADTRTDVEKAFLLQYIPALECSTDADCPMGRMCFMKKCIAQPFSPTGLGTACTVGTDCDSGICAMAGDEKFCSQNCTVGDMASCPVGLECLEAGAGGACWPIKEDSGCCDASGSSAASMLFGIGLFGLAFGRRRRR